MEEATAQALFERPLHPYTLGLLESIPTMEETGVDEPLYMIPGMVPNPLNLPAGCAFATALRTTDRALRRARCRRLRSAPTAASCAASRVDPLRGDGPARSS